MRRAFLQLGGLEEQTAEQVTAMHAALLILANDVSRRTGLVLQAPAPGGRCGPGTVGTLVSRPFWTLHTRAGCHHTPARPPDGVPGMLRHNGPSDVGRSGR